MLNYKLFLIRHGFTDGNVQGKYIGATDLPLCKEGALELKKLKADYEYPKADIIYTSPLQRCVETANILYPDHYLKRVSKIMECNFGEFENRKLEDLENDPRYLQWMKKPGAFTPLGGESLQEFKQRIAQGLDMIIQDMMTEKINCAAVVSHGGVIMEMLHSFGLPQRSPMEWTTEYGQGYTLVTSAQLWARGKKCEVFSAIPYLCDKINFPRDYDLIDISDE